MKLLIVLFELWCQLFNNWNFQYRMCLLIQFFCLGKIRSLLPYQPVYSKEMADRIEKIEHDKIDKNSRSIRNSFSFQPVDCLCTYKVLNIQFTVFYFLLFSMPNFKCGCIVLIRPIIIWIYNFFMIRVQRIPAWIKPHQPFFWNNQTVWMSTPRLEKYHGYIFCWRRIFRIWGRPSQRKISSAVLG